MNIELNIWNDIYIFCDFLFKYRNDQSFIISHVSDAMSCEHSQSWIQTRNTLLHNKMTNVIPSSAAFSVATLFVSSILWTVPNTVLSASSNYEGVTRHYQFDVNITHTTLVLIFSFQIISSLQLHLTSLTINNTVPCRVSHICWMFFITCGCR